MSEMVPMAEKAVATGMNTQTTIEEGTARANVLIDRLHQMESSMTDILGGLHGHHGNEQPVRGQPGEIPEIPQLNPGALRALITTLDIAVEAADRLDGLIRRL